MECKIQYLSPTSLTTFENKPDAFVLTYVVGVPRSPQLKVMAVGSAFDAYVKGELARDISGVEGVTKELMKTQVIDAWRIEVNGYGKRLLEQYKSSGAYAKLRSEIGSNCESFGYEFDAKVVLDIDGVKVPIAGKPDLFFRRRLLRSGGIEGGEIVNAIIDWKVSGFLSKASPGLGYSRLLDVRGNDRGPHKDCIVMHKHGFAIGIGGDIKPEWATQITMYSWCLQDPAVPETWVLGIDQLVLSNLTGKYVGPQGQTFKVASYRKVRKDNPELLQRLRKAWSAIQASHYFVDMTKNESDARVSTLANADDSLKWAILEQQNLPFKMSNSKSNADRSGMPAMPTFDDADTHIR